MFQAFGLLYRKNVLSAAIYIWFVSEGRDSYSCGVVRGNLNNVITLSTSYCVLGKYSYPNSFTLMLVVTYFANTK